MANIKISQLNTATTVGAGDVVPIVQGGVTKKIDASLLGGGGGGGGGSIQIPKPEFKIGKLMNLGLLSGTGTSDLKVYYNRIESNEWLNHQPELWLFRLTKRNYMKKKYDKIDAKYYYVVQPKKWSHPKHNVTSEPPIYDAYGHLIYRGPTDLALTTEWSIPNGWLPGISLSGFTFDSTKYWRISTNNFEGISFPYDYGADLYDWTSIHGSGKKNIKSILFKFHFVIRDPNNVHNVLFGPASDILLNVPKRLPSTNLLGGFTLSIRKS